MNSQEEALHSRGVKFHTEEFADSPGFPSSERLQRGAVAVIECIEEIPCDPCVPVCRKGAITIPDPVIGLPFLKEEACDGCGICIPICPGLAIFVVDLNWSEDRARISLPYEFYPLPQEGEKVLALDRCGHPVVEAEVQSVRNPPAFGKTAVVSLLIPKQNVLEVRFFRRLL